MTGEGQPADAGGGDAAPAADGRLLRLGLVIAVVLIVLDQLTKAWILYGADLVEGGCGVPDGCVRLTSFAELVLVWNRGISYGLFQQETELGRWLLVAFAVIASVALVFWLMRTRSRLTAVSIALLIAGALGNAIDRSIYGAVVDFVHLFAFGYSWYVFNVADAAIVAGAVLVLYESLVGRRPGQGG